jgi:hypothetical protein
MFELSLANQALVFILADLNGRFAPEAGILEKSAFDPSCGHRYVAAS